MKSDHTFSVMFYLKASKQEECSGYIFARVTVNGKRAEISLKRKVARDNWNGEKGYLKGNREEARVINKHIDDTRNRIYDHYHRMEREGAFVSAKAIKELVTGKKEREHTLMKLVSDHNQNPGGLLS
ncbi:MAG: Arm DNA-binding domain-containing protein [Bacteroidota bacterium]